LVSRFILNHIGLEQGSSAYALLNVTDGAEGPCELLTLAGDLPVLTPPLGDPLATFRGQTLRVIDLSAAPVGRYSLRFGQEISAPFFIEKELLLRRTLSAVLDYFRSQRCRPPWDEYDHAVPFFGGREGTVDVHGGWYDASGDLSKYLSHLSYANFMNPQQTPLVVWGLLHHWERRLGSHDAGISERLLDEARHGADFLCRMQDPAGYFYLTVFDQWGKAVEKRMICAFQTQKGERLEAYQAGMRQGGGASIAALARAARILKNDSYLQVAEKGFSHLEEHGLVYLDDGRENIIDDYCGLLAATELYATTNKSAYREKARSRARSLMDRVQRNGPVPGWLRADDGQRPYFHAAEAGLPGLALLRASEVDPESAAEYLECATEMAKFELAITAEVENAYGYARQYTQDIHKQRKTAFFIPHQNETGYWWQGENARLASLAAMTARVAAESSDPHLPDALRRYALDQLNWICGRNPFDACMLHGFGRGNGNYMDKWPNVPGGICNGITSNFEDESDVDFGRTDLEGDHSWRWYEQWLPHATWYLIALAELHPSS
jgi:hypothetical protein